MVLDYFENALPFPDYFGEYFLPLPEGVLHEVDFLVVLLEPQHIENHEAELVLVFLVERHHLVHAEGCHLVSLLLNDDYLSVKDALFGDHLLVQHINKLLIQFAVVDGVS